MLADVPSMQITVTHDDGTTDDITEGVQVAFDIAYGSMNWGSGFLDLEEMDAVARLAEACRFPSFEEVLKEVAEKRIAEEHRIAEAARREQKRRQAEEDARIARRQLAFEMRQAEPGLAAYTDSQLARLHAMRNAGTA